MTVFRAVAIAVLMHVGADFLDPSVPGVFFFDARDLFVDGAVQSKLEPDPIPTAAGPAHEAITIERLTGNRPAPRPAASNPVARRAPDRPVARTDTRAPADDVSS